jgi:hypothetical protein
MQVFPNSRIHNIKTIDCGLLVFGSCSFAILSLENDKISILNIIMTKFWIYDAVYLEHGRSVAILNSNNHVENWCISTGSIIGTKKCTERTQIYCGAMFGKTWKSIIVLSGTIFQEILLWSLDNGGKDEYVLIESRFVGHEVNQ